MARFVDRIGQQSNPVNLLPDVRSIRPFAALFSLHRRFCGRIPNYQIQVAVHGSFVVRVQFLRENEKMKTFCFSNKRHDHGYELFRKYFEDEHHCKLLDVRCEMRGARTSSNRAIRSAYKTNFQKIMSLKDDARGYEQCVQVATKPGGQCFQCLHQPTCISLLPEGFQSVAAACNGRKRTSSRSAKIVKNSPQSDNKVSEISLDRQVESRTHHFSVYICNTTRFCHLTDNFTNKRSKIFNLKLPTKFSHSRLPKTSQQDHSSQPQKKSQLTISFRVY